MNTWPNVAGWLLGGARLGSQAATSATARIAVRTRGGGIENLRTVIRVMRGRVERRRFDRSLMSVHTLSCYVSCREHSRVADGRGCRADFAPGKAGRARPRTADRTRAARELSRRGRREPGVLPE